MLTVLAGRDTSRKGEITAAGPVKTAIPREKYRKTGL